MVASEGLAYNWEGARSKLAAQIHGDLPAERNVLGALLGFQVGQPDVEEI